MEQHTAKNFALQLGALISLYVSISFLLVLLFGIITLLFPSASDYYYERSAAMDSIRLGIALIVVFFPTCLLLTRLVNQARRSTTQDSTYAGLVKWLLYLSLLVGGVVLLSDLAIIIMTYLNGDLTVRFALKALSVLVVTGAAFFYYLMDVRGVWLSRERTSITYGAAAAVAMLASIVLGVTLIDTPTEMRERRIDDTQLQSLQSIQSDIISYTQTNGALPKTLSEIPNKNPSTYSAPVGRPDYEYSVTGAGFRLCAQFALPSIEDDTRYAYWDDKPGVFNANDWQHGTGKECFERTVNIGVLRGEAEAPAAASQTAPDTTEAPPKG